MSSNSVAPIASGRARATLAFFSSGITRPIQGSLLLLTTAFDFESGFWFGFKRYQKNASEHRLFSVVALGMV
jgi:hypothetical protein